MQKFPLAAVLGVAGVFGIVILVLWFSGRSSTGITDAESMFGVYEFNTKAREKCLETIKKNTSYETGGLRFHTESDGKASATFVWDGDDIAISDKTTVWKSDQSNFKKLTCKYEKGTGVVALLADDKEVWHP
jgi:hypothetical protein